MPTRAELLANGRTDEEIAREIGADAVIYQDLSDLIAAVKAVNPDLQQFDASCFDGQYITGDVSEAYLSRLEGQRSGTIPIVPSPPTRQMGRVIIFLRSRRRGTNPACNSEVLPAPDWA